MTIEFLRDENRPYVELPLAKGAKAKLSTDWTDRLTRFWQPATPFDVGVAVRASRADGFQWVSGGGVTGASPVFPSNPQLGMRARDGSIMWTCASVDTSSLLTTVATQAWAFDPDLILGTSAIAGQVCSVVVDTTSAVEGKDYYVRNLATMADGTVEVATFLLRIRSTAI